MKFLSQFFIFRGKVSQFMLFFREKVKICLNEY